MLLLVQTICLISAACFPLKEQRDVKKKEKREKSETMER